MTSQKSKDGEPTAPSRASEAAAVTGPLKVKLRKPILKDGDPSSEIEFREPTAGDIERAGQPVLLDFSSDPFKITFDEKKMTMMLSTLAAVPPSSIRSMHPKDWNTCAWLVAGFFTPDLGTE